MRKLAPVLGIALLLSLSVLPGNAATQFVKIAGFRYVETTTNPPAITITVGHGEPISLQNLDPVAHSFLQVPTGSKLCGTNILPAYCDSGSISFTATGGVTIRSLAPSGIYTFFCNLHGQALMSVQVAVS